MATFLHSETAIALYLSGTYCHKTGTKPPSCQTPQQPTIYSEMRLQLWIHNEDSVYIAVDALVAELFKTGENKNKIKPGLDVQLSEVL